MAVEVASRPTVVRRSVFSNGSANQSKHLAIFVKLQPAEILTKRSNGLETH
jgi:hypothetical protein